MLRSTVKVSLLGLLVGCSTLGPKANVTVLKEQSKTKEVENIVVANVTGIDATGNTGKAMLATALKAYGTRSRPVAAADAVLSAAGAPNGLADMMTASYQVGFAKAVDEYMKAPENKRKAPESIDLPTAANGKDIKGMVSGLQKEASAIGGIAAAMKSGNSSSMAQSLDKSKSLMSKVQKLDELVFAKLDVTYVLVTHVIGDEGAWMGGKPVKMAVALINAKSGKLRYFATVDAKKGAIPTPYMAQLGIMASNLFDAVGDKDALPEKKDDDNKTAKKKSGKESAMLFVPMEG